MSCTSKLAWFNHQSYDNQCKTSIEFELISDDDAVDFILTLCANNGRLGQKLKCTGGSEKDVLSNSKFWSFWIQNQ